MVQICEQTYLNNLQKRAFLALVSRKYNKDNAQFMLNRARQFLTARSTDVLFNAWRDAVNTIKQRRMLALEVERFYNKKILRRVH